MNIDPQSAEYKFAEHLLFGHPHTREDVLALADTIRKASEDWMSGFRAKMCA